MISLIKKMFCNLFTMHKNLIKDQNIEAEILFQDQLNMKLKVLKIKNRSYHAYFNNGDILTLNKHDSCLFDLELWEVYKVNGKSLMLENTYCGSQLLLYHWSDTGWSWEIDC